MNIKFEYLYRDAGNYKNWGSVVFSNPDHCSTRMLHQKVSDLLIDQQYFYADKVRIPDLHFSDNDSDLDHAWHEYDSFSVTDEPLTDSDSRTVLEFINKIADTTV